MEPPAKPRAEVEARLSVEAGNGPRYAHVLVDEVQDFSLEALRVLDYFALACWCSLSRASRQRWCSLSRP